MMTRPFRKTAWLWAFVLLTIPTLVSAGARQNPKERPANKGPGVPKDVVEQYKAGRFEGLPYRFLMPSDYDPGKKYPLILSLHGAGGVGNDNLSNLRNWNAIFVDPAWRKEYQCFVVVPQSQTSWLVTGEKIPELNDEKIAGLSRFWQEQIERRRERVKERDANPGRRGSLSIAVELVEKFGSKYSVDTDRIYVLGHSMGGFGSWNAIWARPDLFAAAIPTAGGIMPWKDWSRFSKVPVWTFHGAADPVVSVQFTREVFGKMKELGGNVKFTELKDVNHGVSKHAFEYKGDDPDRGYITHYASSGCDKTEDVWQWLFSQRRRKR